MNVVKSSFPMEVTFLLVLMGNLFGFINFTKLSVPSNSNLMATKNKSSESVGSKMILDLYHAELMEP